MEASYYRKLEDGAVECQLCAHQCVIQPGEMGICRCRVNDNGTLIAKTYGRDQRHDHRRSDRDGLLFLS